MNKETVTWGDAAFRSMETLEERDKRLEELWGVFEDIPMDPETECMEEKFLCFPAGTHREEIWHWFDERHSRGVAYLLYGVGVERTPELSKLAYRKSMCEECMADCIFSPEGECLFPLVSGRKPEISDEEGCDDCIPTYLSGL